MSTYLDTYVSCADATALETFASNFINHVPVQAGRDAITGQIDPGGNPIPDMPPVGNPALFYTLVRATFDISPIVSPPFAVVDPATGAAICGIFA